MKKIVLTILLSFFLKDFVNGQSWSAVGPGMGSSYGFVTSFATYNGELYAGGYFETAGNIPVNNIARWNGTNWSAVGNGIEGSLSSLCVFNGELYAGGYFETAGNILANSIAKWNGTTWSPVGSIQSYGVKAITEFNGELYAAGSFPDFNPYGSTIVKWNGSNWIGILPENELYSVSFESIVVYNGELYAAGAYYQIGGGGVPDYYRITKWNGSNWTDLLTIPASYTLDGALGDIYSMAVYNGELYVAGGFQMMIDTMIASQVAKWNGTTWSVVGTGINAETFPYGGDSDGASYTCVKTLAVCNGTLYAGGRFNYAGNILTRNVAKWDGNIWSALSLGTNANVYALAGFDTSVYAGGIFTAVNGNDIPANKIARWGETCLSAPPQPIVIHGDDTACSNSPKTYYVDESPGTSNYTWILPAGWTGYSTTNTITVITGATDGTMSVTANNSCGNSSVQILNVTILSGNLPSIQSAITGNTVPCYQTTETYFINRVSNGNTYTWSLPSGWTGNSTDTSITVVTSQSGGFITVRANNECGSSPLQVLPVTVALTPQKPDFIYGKETVCDGSSNSYYVSSQPATSYNWELPQGWTGNSITNSIIITAGNVNGIISVSAYNSCGSSDFATMPVSVDPAPQSPGDISGNTFTNTHNVNYYSVDKVPGAIGYNWSDASAVMQGQNTNSISAVWKQPGVYELSLQVINKCGTGSPKKIIVKVTDFSGHDPFDLQIFPNPSNGEFLLKAKRIEYKTVGVEVLAMSGQLMYRSQKKQGMNDFSQRIVLPHLQTGVYAVKVVIGSEVYVKQMVIAR